MGQSLLICDAQVGVSLAPAIHDRLRARGLPATLRHIAADCIVVCIDEAEWHAKACRTELFSHLEAQSDALTLIPVVVATNGGFPNPLPEFLWLRQALVLQSLDDESGLDRLATAIRRLSVPEPSITGADDRVFLCYHSADELLVKRLAADLSLAGIQTWMDIEQLEPGERWQEGLFAALERCTAIAVCVGGRGISAWQLRELEASRRRVQGKAVEVVAVMLPPLRSCPKEADVDIKADRTIVWTPGRPLSLFERHDPPRSAVC